MLVYMMHKVRHRNVTARLRKTAKGNIKMKISRRHHNHNLIAHLMGQVRACLFVSTVLASVIVVAAQSSNSEQFGASAHSLAASQQNAKSDKARQQSGTNSSSQANTDSSATTTDANST